MVFACGYRRVDAGKGYADCNLQPLSCLWSPHTVPRKLVGMLTDTNLEFLLHALRTIRFDVAIAKLVDDPASCEYAAAVELLARCKHGERERLRILLADMLSGYPSVVWVAPILLCYQTVLTGLLDLPSIDADEMPNDVISVSWMPISRAKDKLPASEQGMLPNCHSCVLLVMQTVGTEPPAIDDRWLSGIFSGMPGDGRLEVAWGPVLPHPEGVEAGLLMQSIALSSDAKAVPVTPRYFLSDSGWAQAFKTALAYRERVIASSEHRFG